MNIHLIRSLELDQEKFVAIYDLIHQYSGPVQYLIHEQPDEYSTDEVETEIWEEERIAKKVMPSRNVVCDNVAPYPTQFLRWDSIFDHCEAARRFYHIPDDEPVVLLTEHANEYNWFSGADRNGKRNLFVHTGMWDRYIFYDMRYPVVYLLAAIPLRLQMFDTFEDMVGYFHQEPRGCMNDFCQEKKDIGLKLRTADICPDCRKRIQDRKADPQVVAQVFRVFESIRTQMLFRASFTHNPTPSRLWIDYPKRKVYLTDLGNLRIPLNPMEKTVFHFFLNYPDGVAFSALPDHRNELCTLYRHYSDTPVFATITARIDDICANKRDCLSQVISRIRRKFEDAVPEEIAGQYVIGGEAGRKRKILIDRSLVSIGE
jgi:hypothetical protein